MLRLVWTRPHLFFSINHAWYAISIESCTCHFSAAENSSVDGAAYVCGVSVTAPVYTVLRGQAQVTSVSDKNKKEEYLVAALQVRGRSLTQDVAVRIEPQRAAHDSSHVVWLRSACIHALALRTI